ncbi:GerMN domain-containing protein [Treponema sp. R80B11-R83G3]
MSSTVRLRLLFIAILAIAAISEFFILGLARRTFVFYTINEGVISVEDRMLKRSISREDDIIRYTEEMLLGPVAPDLLPLFPRETRLKSLLYRNGVVFVDFSADAALPPVEGGSTIDNFRTFHAGILRNLSYVKDVRFFIDGNAIYIEEFWPETVAILQEFSDN